MLNAILTRWARTTGALSSTFFARSTQTASPKAGKDSFLQSLLRRSAADAATQAQPHSAIDGLPAARVRFEASLTGLAGDHIDDLADLIRKSRELDDLWHLRMRLYNEIARQFSQHEAEQRLAQLQGLFTASGRH